MLWDECWLTMGVLENSERCLEYSGTLRCFRGLAQDWSTLTSETLRKIQEWCTLTSGTLRCFRGLAQDCSTLTLLVGVGLRLG